MPTDAHELLETVFRLCPEFAKVWPNEAPLWIDDDGRVSFHGVFAGLSHHVVARLAVNPSTDLKPLFDFVEEILVEDADGDQPLGNAAATCFLENVVADSVPDTHLLPLLGRESLKVCKFYGLRV